MKAALLLIFSYLFGSIPFGPILAKIKGVDLRTVGSGNIGATNVLRAMGKGPALITLSGDLLKGAAAVAAAKALGMSVLFEGLAGLSAIAGHNFPVFLGFKGGKGVATSLGAILVYTPQAGILTVTLWLATAFLTKYSSLGALVSFGILPLSVYLFGGSKEKIAVSAAISLMLILRHTENIKRLLRGTERRMGAKA